MVRPQFFSPVLQLMVYMTEPCLYETHMHTPLCKHARGEPEDYAKVAVDRGLAGIIVTCHNPMPDGYSAPVRMSIEEFAHYQELVARAREAYRDSCDVRLGLECDFAPAHLDFVERQIESAPLEYVLGSVHPQVPEYREEYFNGDPVEYQRTYFTHLAEAAETKLFDCLSHPDLVKNMDAESWQLERILDHVCRSLDRIAASGVAMELNTSGRLKVIPEFNPGPIVLREIVARGIPIVVGADAHDPERVSEGYEDALDSIAAAGAETVSFFLERRRRDIPIADAKASLRS